MRYFKVISVIVVALGVGIFFLYWTRPDGPPPMHMAELLSILPEIETAKDEVARYRQNKKTFEGVGGIVGAAIRPQSALLSKIEVNSKGEVSVVAMLTSIQSKDRVPVTIVWIPVVADEKISKWTCHGNPAEYVRVLCSQETRPEP